MKETTIQTNLFGTGSKTANKSKTLYSVQRYRLSYVKENDNLCIKIKHNKDVESFCRQYLCDLPVEHVCIIALDNSNRIIGYEATQGSTNQCSVYTANVFRFLLNSGASSFIICHNHPGGSSNPSGADWGITKRLFDTGKLMDIPLLDHLIVTESDCTSLRQHSQWPS